MIRKKREKKGKEKKLKMSEKYYDQKLKEFLGVVLQAHGYQGASAKALNDYADAFKKCEIKHPSYLYF